MSTVMEIDSGEVVAYNAAVADLHDLCDWARGIRDACELGEVQLSDEERRDIVKIVRDAVESMEMWQTALWLKPMRVAVAAEPKPEEPAQPPPVAYARVGQLGIIAYGAPPNATFGNAVVRRGDWCGR
jgi:hypothetical protein